MACENLSNYYPVIMKFSGYLLLYENTSAIDFGPNRSIPLAGHARKVGLNGLDCSIELKLGVCSVTWGIAPYQFLRRFVNPFIR